MVKIYDNIVVNRWMMKEYGLYAAVLFAEITTRNTIRDGVYEVPEETIARETILNTRQYKEGLKALMRANIVFTKCAAEGKNIIYVNPE